MAVKYTVQQQRVIDTRDCNILVSAAAGSGKTAVLVERIIQKICDEKHPVDIDKLLIVTFTSAAASQMRERISKAIMTRLEQDAENEHLQKQAALIHNAQITTIDSFCLFIIRNNFNAIGLDPGFRIADEGELKLTEKDVMDKLLEDCYSKAEPGFLKFVESYSTGVGEKKIEEAILRLYHFSMSYPFPEEWLLERKNDYALDSIEELTEKTWFQEALQMKDTVLQECRARIQKALALANGIGGPAQYAENLEADLELLENLQQVKGYEALYDAFTYYSFTTLSRKKGQDVDLTIKDAVKAIRDEVKKSVADLKKQLFGLSPQDTLADMRVCQEMVEELVDLTLEFKERLDRVKRDKNLLDFSDMEHFALQILLEKDADGKLIQRETAKELQEYFEEIMIDEYQDSNEVQELLLKSISGESNGQYNRFMVGDVKQSIYKFRLARPEIFMEKYNTYDSVSNEAKKQRIDLSMNFRSRREVTEAANYICGQIMRKEVGNVDYDDKSALFAGAVYPAGDEIGEDYTTEVLIATPQSQNEAEKIMDAKETEAYMVAERIRALVGHFQVTDEQTGKPRMAKYSDIVILFRATSGWDEEFRKVLSSQGIPVHVTSKTGYFQTLEVQGILNFLRVLDNPLQDIAFFGVLKLPFWDISEADIARIKCFYKENEEQKRYLYEQTVYFCRNVKEEDLLRKKSERVLKLIDDYRMRISYTPIKELIAEFLNETGYGLIMGAMPDGQQRLANIELLLERAGAFAKTSFYGLFHFIRYLENVQEQEVDFGEANILDENADVVRIMTIHKSKGLEFPICFVCGLSKQFNQMDIRQSILMDVELGIGVDYINPVLRIKRKTLRKNMVAQRMKEDTRGEDLRVLYVALTRAKEKLILTGYQEDFQKKLNAQLPITMENDEKLPYSVMMGADSYFDLILAALMRHDAMKFWLEEAGLPFEKHKLAYGDIPFKISVWNQQENMLVELKEIGQAAALEDVLIKSNEYADLELEESFREKLMFEYPHTDLEGLTVKTTVSELKKAAYEEADEPVQELIKLEREPYIPRFMTKEQEIAGTQYGTAVHKVMELFSFDEEYLEAEYSHREVLIQKEMESWISNGIVKKSDIECVKAYKIAEFLKCDVAKGMIKAAQSGNLFKEQPFVIGRPASELDDKFSNSETILIQGVIDAFYIDENDCIVLLDYKTDRVERKEQLIERYQVQLEYYQRALEQLTGKVVIGKKIYSFALQEEIDIV